MNAEADSESLDNSPHVQFDDARLEQSIEVSAFQYHHGLSESAACELVGIDRRDLARHNTAPSRLQYLPMPAEITALTSQIRTGEIAVRKSGYHWGLIQDAQAANDDDAAHELDFGDDDNDGSFPAVMPRWFRG